MHNSSHQDEAPLGADFFFECFMVTFVLSFVGTFVVGAVLSMLTGAALLTGAWWPLTAAGVFCCFAAFSVLLTGWGRKPSRR